MKTKTTSVYSITAPVLTLKMYCFSWHQAIIQAITFALRQE